MRVEEIGIEFNRSGIGVQLVQRSRLSARTTPDILSCVFLFTNSGLSKYQIPEHRPIVSVPVYETDLRSRVLVYINQFFVEFRNPEAWFQFRFMKLFCVPAFWFI